jgi:hypothetical protein
MKRFAFISRHLPTQEQIDLAIAKSIELVHVGDMDAFNWEMEKNRVLGHYDGVIVVHAWLALQCANRFDYVGVFENANRAPEGEKPSFYAKALHVMQCWNADRAIFQPID